LWTFPKEDPDPKSIALKELAINIRCGGQNGKVWVSTWWDIYEVNPTTNEISQVFSDKKSPFDDFFVSHTETHLYLRHFRGSISKYSLVEKSYIVNNDSQTNISHLLLSNDESTVILFFKSGGIELCDDKFNTLPDGEMKHHQGTVNGKAFSPDQTLLCTGGDDKTMVIWDVKKRKLIRTFEDHPAEVKAVAWSQRFIVSGCFDCIIRVWDPKTSETLKKLVHHGSPIKALHFGGYNDSFLFSLASNPHWEGVLWNLETATIYRELPKSSASKTPCCYEGEHQRWIYSDRTTVHFTPLVSLQARLVGYDFLKKPEDNLAEVLWKYARGAGDIMFQKHGLTLIHATLYLNLHDRLKILLDYLIENEIQIALIRDTFGKNPLEIALEKGIQSSVGNLLTYAQHIPPQYVTCTRSFVEDMFKQFPRMAEITSFLDSRISQTRPDFRAPKKGHLIRDDEVIFFSFERDPPEFKLENFSQGTNQRNIFNNQILESSLSEIKLDQLRIEDICGADGALFDTMADLPEHHSIFSSSFLTMLIRFKWRNFGSKVHGENFRILMAYTVVFGLYTILLFQQKMGNQLWSYISYAPLVLLTLFQLYWLRIEFMQAAKESSWRYFLTHDWNFIDMLFILLSLASFLLDFFITYQSLDQVEDYYEPCLITIKSGYAIIYWFTGIKIFYYMRGFVSTSSSINMIISIVGDMKNFSLVMVVSLLMCGFSFFLLTDVDVSSDDGSIKDIYWYSFFTSLGKIYITLLGDTELAEYDSVVQTAIWIPFIILTLFMVIIMLNLLIAIMGDTFDRQQAMSKQIKNYQWCLLLAEYEKLVRKDTKIQKYPLAFQSSLFWASQDRSRLERNEGAEWEGRVHEMTRAALRSREMIMQKFKEAQIRFTEDSSKSNQRIDRLENTMSEVLQIVKSLKGGQIVIEGTDSK